MIIIITLSVLLILLIAHLLILPLSKKRPVFIKGFEGSFLVAIFLAVIAAFIHPILYIFAIIIGMLIYYTESWLVYGIQAENINNALEKATLASRATSAKVTNGYMIDDNMLVSIKSMGGRVCFIRYNSKAYSKKSELTKDIFRKFMQNYFI